MNVKVGETYEVEIKRLTRIGDGFVKIKGFPIFVKRVYIGWKGKIKIKRVSYTYAVAEPID